MLLPPPTAPALLELPAGELGELCACGVTAAVKEAAPEFGTTELDAE
jgi:hypothetical protein